MKPSLPAKLAVLSFGLLSLIGTWIIIYGGGFYHSPGKHSADAVFYTGTPALLMAAIQGTASALAFTWLLRQRLALLPSASIAGLVVFVPTVFYVVLRW